MRIGLLWTKDVLTQGLVFLTCVSLATVETPSPHPGQPSSSNNSANQLDVNRIISPVIDVIHGKVNSVTHDISGSFSEVHLVTEINNLTLEPVKNNTEQPEITKLPENLNLNASSHLIEHEHSPSFYIDNVTLSPPSDLKVSSDHLVDDGNPSSPMPSAEEDQLVRPPASAADESPGEKPVVDDVPSFDHFVPTPPPVETLVVSTSSSRPPLAPPVDQKNASVDHPDDIPSFSEWAKKQMAEVEKNKGENLTVGTSTKMRLKNHASPDCGAKVVAANPEAISASAILSPSRDDYMLSPCNVKIWFVVELCEVIQPQRLEIANFELFSSSPQDMSVFVSDRFPTREWGFVGTVQAKDERTVQSFSLPRVDLFAKYVKVELLSHYGSEHYCPISLFKAFGTSELEILDNVDNASNDDDDDASGDSSKSSPVDDEEERTLPVRTIQVDTDDLKKEAKAGGDNLFGTAKKAVVSFMKKAAVLVTGGEKNSSCSCPPRPEHHSPGYLITCRSRSEQFCRKLCTTLCCQMSALSSYLKNSFVSSILRSTPLCSLFGFESYIPVDDSSRSDGRKSVEISYLRALITDETLAALCHVIATSPMEFLKNNTSISSPNDDENLAMSSQILEESAVAEPADHPPPSPLPIAPTKTLPEDNSTDFSVEMSLPGIDPSTTSNDSSSELQGINANASSEAMTPPELQSTAASESPSPGGNLIVDVNITRPPASSIAQPPPQTPSADPSAPVAVTSSQNESQATTNNGFTGETSSLESIISELTEDDIRTVGSNGNGASGGESSATVKSSVRDPPVAKESVFVRLANRIKALEVNISLSSQYLEELSRRYKRQVEELQRSLSSVVEERRLAIERESLQLAQIAALTAKVEILSESVARLLSEQNSWSPNFYVFKQHGFIIAIELVMVLLVVVLFGWLSSQTKSNECKSAQVAPQRRHSMDEIDSSSKKIRRPSEEALVPSSATHQELLKDSRKTFRDGRTNKRKRRRKDKTDDACPFDTLEPIAPSCDVATLSATGEDEPSSSHLPMHFEPPPPAVIPCTPPSFFRTAQWTRKHRTSSIHTQTSSSRETVNSTTNSTSSPLPSKKKTGALRKIVRKFF